ncbi:MAG: phosphate signaling complex protein PhoU [Acidobacteria bacterium]|nr:phosphate signaling complex protein PhoU [Acidobacteriota bacterium]MYD69491.1 phosphate signaling complex protein PhoU [Acidobacteriota bacterium]MYJ04141.1 phosphate signaling complex protein PhoU [Acidobacteriota bacterium]
MTPVGGDDKSAVVSFDEALSTLKERLLAMGGQVEEQVRASVQALVSRDLDLAEQVLGGDKSINDFEIEIDKRCYELLVNYHPDAEDVRVVVSGLKINSDLERIGDFAINIAEATFRYLQHPPVKPLIDIPRMADLAQGMLRDSLNAYVRHGTSLAREVLDRDDELDGLKEQVFRELLSYVLQNPATTEPALELILISRHLERIGDHATNVAEEVIFMVSGRDVRHHAQEGKAGY